MTQTGFVYGVSSETLRSTFSLAKKNFAPMKWNVNKKNKIADKKIHRLCILLTKNLLKNMSFLKYLKRYFTYELPWKKVRFQPLSMRFVSTLFVQVFLTKRMRIF